MPISSSNFGALLEPGLRKVFFQTYREKPEQFPIAFDVKKSKKAEEKDQHVAGVGEWPEKESMGAVQYEDILPGEDVSYIHKEYAKGCQVERKFVDDEMYDVIRKLPKSLARGGRKTVEKIAASVLNGGFSNIGYDGVALFSDSHPLYGNDGGTADNLASGPLNDVNLKDAVILARKQVDDAKIKIECMPRKLIVPPDLEFTAIEILESTRKSGTADNDTNSIRGRLKHYVMDYLTSATAWFLQDPDIENLIFFWRVRPEFNRAKDFDTMIQKYIGYLRFSCGYSDWRGMVGSQGI